MATEISRETIGYTDTGEICIITFQDNDIKYDKSKEIGGTTVDHVNRYVVRQGGKTILETSEQSEAQALAKALAKGNAIVKPGVDERRMSEVGPVTPHAHRIAAHEVRPEAESDKVAADEPARHGGNDEAIAKAEDKRTDHASLTTPRRDTSA